MADPQMSREELMEYFAELDPDERQRMLDAIADSDIDSSITTFCRRMFRRRYTDPKDPGTPPQKEDPVKPAPEPEPEAAPQADLLDVFGVPQCRQTISVHLQQ